MTTRTLWIFVVVVAWSAWSAWSMPPVRAQQPTACTPVLLCQSGGTGGPPTGGGGSGGRGGAGGAGTGGRGGTGGQPAGGLVITAALELDKRILKTGQVLNASVTYGNTSASTVAVREIRIAARAPGATHEGGPYTDLSPVLTNLNLEPGMHVTLNASRTFSSSDTPGEWEAYATHQDSAGKWHDAPSERFAVVASAGPTPPPTGQMSVGTQEWFIAPWAGTTIYKSNVNWATAYGSGADIWNPQFITDLQGFVLFRHMDTNAVNFSKISLWSQRKLPTDPRNQEVYIDGGSSSDTTGLAIEWQIDLCNRANLDCWFTHPYLADDDYIRQQATLVKAKLSPALKVYIELSNEVWNGFGGFSQYQQAIDAGKAGGLPGMNDYYKGIAHEMYRALQIYGIYQEVFGAAAMGERVIRVFSESGNLDLTTQALNNVYRSSTWNPAGQKIDMIGLAPYIGNGVNGASETLSRWKSEVDAKVNDPIGWVKQNHADAYGIARVGCYEAGMHHLQNADQWARNPQAYDAYVYMLDRFATKLNAPCALYTLHGVWEPKGAWGLYNNVGQAVAQAPKARGAKEWIAGTATRETGPNVRLLIIVLIVIAFMILAWFVCVRLYAARSRVSSPTPAPPPPADPPSDPDAP